jgi:hypothetical protein
VFHPGRLASLFKSKIRLEAENAALRHQLIVLRRNLGGRARLTNHDRWFFVQLYRWFPSILTVLTIIQPATLMRWHRHLPANLPSSSCGSIADASSGSMSRQAPPQNGSRAS